MRLRIWEYNSIPIARSIKKLTAFDCALRLLAERPPRQTAIPQTRDVEFRVVYDDKSEKLCEILEYCRVFLLPEQRAFLTKAGYIPPLAGPTPWTPEQRAAQSHLLREFREKLFDSHNLPTPQEILRSYPTHELLTAAMSNLEGATSPRLREAVEELIAVLEAE